MMDNRGKHVASGSSAFIRDLVVMAVGIVIVGALLYGGLSVLANMGDDGDQPTSTTPVASDSTATTSQTTSSTTTSPTTSSTAAATSSTTTTQPAPRDPSEVTVIVLNSTQRSGIAAQLTQALTNAGYQTLTAANYEGGTLDQTRIWFTAAFQLEAEALLPQVPDALVEPYDGPDQGADIVVVLGTSFDSG